MLTLYSCISIQLYSKIANKYSLNSPKVYFESEEFLFYTLNHQYVKELTLYNPVLNQSWIYFIATVKERLQKFLHPNVECHANLNLKDVCSLGRVSWKAGSLQWFQTRWKTNRNRIEQESYSAHASLNIYCIPFTFFFFFSFHPRKKQVCYFRIYFHWALRVERKEAVTAWFILVHS